MNSSFHKEDFQNNSEKIMKNKLINQRISKAIKRLLGNTKKIKIPLNAGIIIDFLDL